MAAASLKEVGGARKDRPDVVAAIDTLPCNGSSAVHDNHFMRPEEGESEARRVIRQSHVSSWCAESRALPAPDPIDRAVSKGEAVRLMAPDLRALLGRGYSLDQILAWLATKGLTVHRDTLRRALRPAKRVRRAKDRTPETQSMDAGTDRRGEIETSVEGQEQGESTERQPTPSKAPAGSSEGRETDRERLPTSKPEADPNPREDRETGVRPSATLRRAETSTDSVPTTSASTVAQAQRSPAVSARRVAADSATTSKATFEPRPDSDDL